MGGESGGSGGRWANPIVVALVGGLVGAAATYLVTVTAEQDKLRLQLETAAFQAYADAQSAWIAARDDDAAASAGERIRRASVSIALFADATVLDALADFIASIDQRPDCTLIPQDIAVYRAIRAQAASVLDRPASDRDLAMALFGCRLAVQQPKTRQRRPS